MKFHFLTIFPEIINSYVNESILRRAQENKKISITVLNPRDYTKDKHKKVDDKVYGGGPGMVMSAEPILRSIDKLKIKKNEKTKFVMLSPGGKKFTNEIAKKWTKNYKNIVFICGRYEGVDDRVRKITRAEEISIGDYVLTGGEIPALVIADSVSRQISGVLGRNESLEENRVASSRVYTRPENLKWKKKNYKVPKVLVSGNHKEIEEWRKNQKSI